MDTSICSDFGIENLENLNPQTYAEDCESMNVTDFSPKTYKSHTPRKRKKNAEDNFFEIMNNCFTKISEKKMT